MRKNAFAIVVPEAQGATFHRDETRKIPPLPLNAALRQGDVSVATPLLGAKVIFVAFITSFLFGDPVGVKWWVAAAICTCGIFLVTGAQPRTEAWGAIPQRPPSIR
jgi:EamA-like transporter family